MGAASSTSLRVQPGPPEGDTTRCDGAVEPTAVLPPACEDCNWLKVGLSTLVGTGDELAGKGAGDFGRALTERRDSSNVRDNQAARLAQVSAASSGSCDEEDEWLEASLCLSVSSLSREEMALVVARVRQKLFKTLSCLCSQDDAFCDVVAQRIHVMQCVHAAMSRQRRMQLETDDREADVQPNDMVARESMAGLSEDNPSSCAASGDQLLGLQLFFSLLEFVRDPECSQEQLTDFLQQIAPVLSSLPPLCLAGRHSDSSAGVRSNHPMPRTSAPCVVDSLRRFLATLALADKLDDNFPRKGDERGIDTHPSSDRGRRGVALSAMISLVAARGRAGDILLLVKVLISARHRPSNAVEGLQDDDEANSIPGEAVFREEHVMADCSAKRRPTSRTKGRTSRQGLPIDYDDGDDQGLIDATVLTRPALAVVVGPAVPVTDGDVVGDPWKSVTLGHSPGQGEGGEPLDTHPAKARKGKGERVKLAPPITLEPEPWKRVEYTSNEHNSAPDPSPAVVLVNDDTDGVEAKDILPLLRQLHAATPNGDLGSGKAGPVHEQEVWTCGQNSYGELGHSDTGTRKIHCLVKTLADREVVDVAAGNEHTVLLCRTGEVFTAGYNDNGQCGQGATQRVGVLTCVPNLAGRRAVQVHAYNGCEHTLVVLDDGQLVSFGYNYRGQLGHGNTSSEPVPKPVRGLDGIRVTQVSCSYYHSVIACDNGEVYAFGRNDFGQLASGDTIDRKLPGLVESLRGQRVTSLACGQYHTVISTLEVGVQSCGKNDYGQLGVEPTGFQMNLVVVKGALDGASVRHLRCGYYHTIVLMAGERVLGFGRNDYGQLGLGHITQRVFGPRIIEGAEGKGISKVSAGCYHTVLVGSDGMLYVFGRNHHGQLGTGDTNERHSPFPVDTFLGKRIAKVAAGFYHTIVLTGGRDEETSKLGSRGTTERFSPRNILAHPALVLPRDASSEETTAEMAKENLDNFAIETTSPEISSPVCNRGSPGVSSGSPTIKLCEKGDPRMECRTGRGICHGDGRVSGRKAAVVIMAHMDRLADSYAAPKGGVPVVGSTGATPANGSASCHRDQRGKRSDEENVSSNRGAYCVDTSPHTFELLDAILAAVTEEELFGDPAEDTHFQVYMLLAALRVLKANLARLLESSLSTRIITSSMAQAASFDLDDENDLQVMGRIGHDPDLYTLLFYSSADGQVIADDHTTPVMTSHDGLGQHADAEVRDKANEESAGDARLRSEAERYCNVLCCLQRRLLLLVQSGPFCRGGVGGGVGAGVELVQREAAAVLILGLELFFTGQAKQFRLLSTLLNTAAVEDDDERESSVGGECDTTERSMGGPRAARHFILVPLLRRLCDDALASKLIPYGADAEKGGSVCSVVEVADPSLRGYRVTAASPRLLEMQVALLVDLIAQGNPCAISSGESFADDERAATFMPAHQEGSPFSVLQLNGSATNRTESFGLESNSVSKPVEDGSNDASRTQRLYVEVILTLTKHMMHWAASDRITLDPGLWQSLVVGGFSVHEREADPLLLEKDAPVKISGWFATRTKRLCDRAAAVVLDGVNRTPSSWCCLIKHAHLILKHSTAILEAALERGTQSHEESGEGDAGVDTRQLDQLKHTLVGLLLPAVVTGLLPFAQIPVFARRLLDVVNATVVLMDEACYKCSGIRRADADYVAARNGDAEAVAVNRKPQTLFVRGDNGKLGAGGTAGRCTNGKPAPLEAETGRKSPVGTRHNSHNLPWLLSLAKTTALLAGRLAATLVVGDCGISPILESFARSPVYASWMKSDLLAGGCDASYERIMIAPLDTENKDGSTDRGVSTVVKAAVISANGGLVHKSSPAASRENLDQFLEGVADGCGQGGRFAAWLSEVHAPTDTAYRLIKRQAAAGRDGEALERAERAMLAAMLKHGGLEGDAALFSARFQLERGDGNAKDYSRKPPRRLVLLSKRIAEMVGWLWHSRSKLKSSDAAQSNVAALLEEATDTCLTLTMFRPTAVVPPVFAPERQGTSHGSVSALHVAARRRWRKAAAAIRAMIRWRSVVSGRFSTEASVVVPRFMRAMLISKSDPGVPQELLRSDGEVNCGEFSVGSLSVLLILVLDNHQRAVARTCGLRSFRTLVGMVKTPSLLADILLPLAPAMQTPQLVDRQILTHLSAAGRDVTLGVTAAFEALLREILRLAEESCLSQRREDEGVASSTVADDRVPIGNKVARSNGCNYPTPRLLDVRTILVLIEVLGLNVRPEDWGFMETAGIIRIVALVAAAPLGVDGDSSNKSGAGIDNSGRADSTREHETAWRRGHASQLNKKAAVAASSDRTQRSFATCRAAAWTLFRALIIQLHPMAPVTRLAETTPLQAASIMEVLHKELSKCVGKAQAISGDIGGGTRRGGCRWDGEGSKHRDRTPSQAILEFAPPLIGGFPNSPPHAQATSGVKMYGAGASHKRRCQELVSSPCRLMNMEDGLVFPAEHVLSNPRGSDFSITFWLLLAQDQTGHHRTVLARGHGSERWPVVLLRNTDNRLEVCFGIPSMGNLCERLTSKEPIQVNTWTHVGLISEHNKLRLYFNGALDCQRTSTGALRANRHPLYVGKVPDGTMRLDGVRGGVEGSIASLRYFTRALSPIHVRIICDPGPPEPAKVEDWHLYQLCACLLPISRSPQCRRHLQHPAWLKLVLQAFTHGTLRVQQAVCRLLREILPQVPPSVMANVAVGAPGSRATPLPLGPGEQGDEGGGDVQTAFIVFLLRLVGASLWHTGAKASTVNGATDRSHEDKSEEEGEATVAQILLREQVMRFVPLTITPLCLRGGQAGAESARNNNGSDTGGSMHATAEGTAVVCHPTSALSPEATHGISMIGAELVALVQTLAATEVWGKATALALRQSLGQLTRFVDATGELAFPKESDDRDVAAQESTTAEGRLIVAGGEAALHVLGGAIDFLCAGARARVRETNQRCIVLSADQATSTVHVILHPEDGSALDKWVQRFGAHDLEVDNSDSLSLGAMVAFSDNIDAALPENGGVSRYEYISEVMAALLRTSPLPRPRCISGKALKNHAETAYREIVLAQSRSCLARVVLRASRNTLWATSAVETCDLLTELVKVSVLPRSTTNGVLSDESIAEMEAIAIQARLHQMLGMPGGGDIVAGKIVEMAVNPGKMSFLEKERERDLDGGEGNDSRQERNGANRRSSVSSTEGALLDGMGCPFCHETKTTVSGMVEHVLTKHSSDMRRMPCPICVAEKGDNAVHDLPTHLELVHLDAVLRGRRSLLPAFGQQRREAGARGLEARAPSHLVDQLMVIGFPEEWCTMALRENDNDVVNASAWIVDNLDMLSSLNSLSASPADDTGEGNVSSPRVHAESSDRSWQMSHRFLQEGLGRRDGVGSVNNRVNRGQQGELGGGGRREEKYSEEDELDGDNSDDEGEQRIGEREEEEEEDEGDEEEDDEEEGDNDEEEDSDDHADDEEGGGEGQREAFDSEEEDEEEDQEDETEDGNSRYSIHGIGRHQQVIVVPPSRPALNDALDGEHHEIAGNHRITDGLVVSGHRDSYFGMENSETHAPGDYPHNTSNPSKGSQFSAVNSKIAGMELCQLTEVWLHTELQLTTLCCRAALVNILLRWPPHVPMRTASFGSPATVVKLIQNVLFSGQDLPITFADDRHCDSVLQPVPNGSQPPKVLGVFASLLVHLLHSERDACCSPRTPLASGTEATTDAEWDSTLIDQAGGQSGATLGDKGDWRNSLSARLVSDCLDGLDAAAGTSSFTDVPWIAMESSPSNRLVADIKSNLQLLQWLLDLLLSVSCADVFTENVFSRLSNCLNSPNVAAKEVAMYSLTSVATRWCEHLTVEADQGYGIAAKPTPAPVVLPSPLAMEETFQRHMTIPRVRSALVKRIAVERRPGGLFFTRYTQTLTALYVAMVKLQRLFLLRRRQIGSSKGSAGADCAGSAEVSTPTILYSTDSSVALTWLPMRKAASTSSTSTSYEVQMAARQLGIKEGQDMFRCVYTGKRLRCRVEDLMPGQVYRFRLRAVYSTAKTTTWSAVATAETEQGIAFRFDSANSGPAIFVSGNELSASFGSNETWSTILGTTPFYTGSNYWEFQLDKSATNYLFIGVATRDADLTTFLGGDDYGWGFIGDRALYHKRTKVKAYGERFGQGDTIGVTLNMDRGTLSFSKNGHDLGVAFEGLVGGLYPAVAFYNQGQRLSLVPSAFRCPGAGVTILTSPLNTTPEDVSTVYEVMEAMVSRNSLPLAWMEVVRAGHLAWVAGTTVRYATSLGFELQFDVSDSACRGFGMKARRRVRTPRGIATVIGICDGVMWFHVDGEPGAWFFTAGEIWEGRATGCFAMSPLDALGAERSGGRKMGGAFDEQRTDHQGGANNSLEVGHRASTAVDAVSGRSFGGDLAAVRDCARWTPIVDGCIVAALCDHADRHQVSVWNVTPAEVLNILSPVRRRLESLLAGAVVADDALLCRVSVLKQLNHELVGVLPFADLAEGVQVSGRAESRTFCWGGSSRHRGLAVGVGKHPTRGLGPLLVCLRQSIFLSTKEKTLSQSVNITTTHSKRAEDEYDYPEDLPQVTVNRLKAVAGQESPDIEARLRTSVFHQLYRELRDIDTSLLRMGYMHPMDDGQRRTFKVKFEGEGVDDYGGPYREIFTQVASELTSIISSPTADNAEQAFGSTLRQLGQSLLPILEPTPSTRSDGSGDGAEAEFMVKANVQQQRYLRMYRFLGQLMGIALRCRVAAPWRLSRIFWKGLVGEALQEADLVHIDSTAHAFVKSIHERVAVRKRANPNADEKADLASLEGFTMESILTGVPEGSTTAAVARERIAGLGPGVRGAPVKSSDLSLCVQEVAQAWLREGDRALFAVRDGFTSVVPSAALPLFTWEEIELQACGRPGVDVDLLERNTEYDDDMSPSDAHIQSFWRVLRAFDDRDRSQFLRFVWARSRLPSQAADFHQKFKIHSPTGEGAREDPDQYLPKAHTCFFSINLPRYSSDEVMAKKLSYTMYNCIEMDADFRLADNEMPGWESEAANRSSREQGGGDSSRLE